MSAAPKGRPLRLPPLARLPPLGRGSPAGDALRGGGEAGAVAPQNRLIQIFRDHWEPFKQFYPHLVNKDIEVNVQKMMACGLLANGYAEYRCRCGHIKRVPFSCKSRFCLRCARVYIDKWVAKMKETVFAKVKHRHIILTVPGSLC
ncbi:MAG: transposase zinc-binding domain-containing protein, partial [Planctomycetota bacterium]|nr:transposase zinc-binding domain-containing protein [Planctomycetota bacterium]